MGRLRLRRGRSGGGCGRLRHARLLLSRLRLPLPLRLVPLRSRTTSSALIRARNKRRRAHLPVRLYPLRRPLVLKRLHGLDRRPCRPLRILQLLLQHRSLLRRDLRLPAVLPGRRYETRLHGGLEHEGLLLHRAELRELRKVALKELEGDAVGHGSGSGLRDGRRKRLLRWRLLLRRRCGEKGRKTGSLRLGSRNSSRLSLRLLLLLASDLLGERVELVRRLSGANVSRVRSETVS